METGTCTTVSLGKPIQAPVLIPVIHAATPNCVNEPFMVDGQSYRVTCVSFGTPHGVVFVDDIESTDVTALGAALGAHSLFPQGASIVFVQALDGEQLKARVWQRGVGEVASTPEALGVALTAACLTQKVFLREADVSMGGHSFHVEWKGEDNSVYVTGPAELLSA